MSDDTPWMPPAGGEDAVPEPDGAPVPTLPPAAAPAPAPTVAPTMPPPPVAPSVATPGGFPGGQAPADSPLVTVGEPVGRSSRSKWFLGAAAAAVVAVGGAGVFAVSNLTGSTAGGASSPEELGFELMTAIENEDVLGVIDVLSPGERDVFRDPLVDLVDELTRLEVLSDDADLSRLLGVDVVLTDESVSAVSTNVPDITNIDMRADATITLDGSELPIGELITDNMPADMVTEMRGTRLTETDELDVRLTAVEENGRWYFSVLHTIAELARTEVAPGTLIPSEGIGADGADTPGDAFEGMLDAVERLDLTGLLRTLNPGEAAALQRYAPLFLEDAEAVLAEVPLDWEISRREYRVDESGDSATIFLDAIAIDATIEGESISVEFADECVRVEGGGESFEQCNTGAFDDDLGLLDEAPAVQALLDTVTEAFSDVEEVGLEMRRTDGLWYVSPSRTVSEAMLTVLRALDRQELDAIIEQAPAAGEEFFDQLLGGFAAQDFSVVDTGTVTVTDSDVAVADTADGTTSVSEPDTSSSDGSFDLTVEDDEFASNPGDNCYSELDPIAATECFELAVASGDLPPIAVPVALRFPECGYQVAWGELYSLSDADFIAAAEAARPCFLDLVERGEISDYELPTEIAYLECFEGRNWYNVFDDPEYDDRYYDCLESAYAE